MMQSIWDKKAFTLYVAIELGSLGPALVPVTYKPAPITSSLITHRHRLTFKVFNPFQMQVSMTRTI